jgi:hypothetical protein
MSGAIHTDGSAAYDPLALSTARSGIVFYFTAPVRRRCARANDA